MAPKGKDAGKGKGKAKATDADDSASGKLKPAQSINVRHILCEKHSKKEEALAKLREGAKFEDVAREFSEDKARQGGSLGWKTRGSLHGEFEKVAYDLQPGTIGEVKTSHGCEYQACTLKGTGANIKLDHIILVEGRK